MKDLFNLDGKVAVVNGGAGGIGEALATGLATYGAKVVVSDLYEEASQKVAEKIKAETGVETMGVGVDVTDEKSVEEMMQKVVKKFGQLDITVNSMGVNIKRDAFDYPVEDWDKIFDVNVKGTMICCKVAGRIMRNQKKGAIINLSSVRGIRGYTGGNAGYCATKGAVEMITKTLAVEWASEGIRVNAIGPALIITPGTKHIQENPELAKKYAAAIPMGRIGQTEDLVGTCVFLASEASGFMTGQTLFVDGGMTAA